ncbi:H-NS histone family protein [Burkholderia territorii]|uniref:H-NS histone family protein n=1 Tax=Burkholderia territorii TaxID=1503055 RepID=UPI0009BDA1D8|nr:H-NS histone family protein [Burkholderia territorii]
MANSNYQDLVAQIAALQEHAEVARTAERSAVLIQVRELVSTYALTEYEVFGRRRRATAKQPAPPRYRNPQTGQTWSGRGRPPAWINGEEDRDRFLILD